MCSFGSNQKRFEFLSQFRKVRNAFECFVTQVQTHLPKTKRVWPMKINVICNVSKAICPDGIRNRLLKEAASSICGPLSRLDQNSINSGVYPDTWKLANVSALYKKGSVYD